jgi:acyl carrier protein
VVRDAVVVAREDGGESGKQLVAYIVAADGAKLNSGELREQLRERLPDYMIPTRFVQLEEIPLSSNGKVDRKALPVPDSALLATSNVYVGARTAIEELIAGAWAEVLHVEKVGVEDDFFELGGHSLLATQAMARVREIFAVEMPLRVLFERPTVAGLAEQVEQARRAGRREQMPPIERAEREGGVPLSFAQQRLWFIDQLGLGTVAYNIAIAVSLEGELDVEVLERALDEIVRRHEILRTTFGVKNGQPAQFVASATSLRLPLVDLSSVADAEREVEARKIADEEAMRPFDLSKGPMLRTGLLRLNAGHHVLLFVMHHIVSDGWSMNILTREVTALYQAFIEGQPSPLGELPIQYADYAAWQQRWLQAETLEEQLSYWRQQLVGAPPVLKLPTDRPRPPMMSFHGDMHLQVLPVALSDALRELNRKNNVTLFMTTLAAFNTLLHRLSGQDDIVLGTDIANRKRVEVEGLIGFFVNHLVIRTDLSGDPTFENLLARVREKTLGAYDHQDMPFEKLVESLRPDRNLSHTPLFQVLFVLENTPRGASAESGESNLGISLSGLNHSTTKYDLTLLLKETSRGIAVTWSYSTDLFEAATIVRMAESFQTLLANIVAAPQTRLSELTVLSESERGQLAAARSARQEAKRNKLRSTRRKAVEVDDSELVSTSYVAADHSRQEETPVE